MYKKVFSIAILAVLAALVLGACASANPQAPTVVNSAPTQVPGGPTQSIPTQVAEAAATQSIPQSGAATAPGTSTGASTAGAVTYQVAPGSTANYRVREQLARLNFPSDAVGKTDAISGQITVLPDGTVNSNNSKFTVDVSTLVSDAAMRDRFVGGNILQTGQYPNVVFVPTKISGLNGTPQPGSNFSFQLTGNLTVRDVTKQVTWDVTGKMNSDGSATADATTNFTFEDFGLNQPQVPVVLSVVDKITLEVSLQLQKVG